MAVDTSNTVNTASASASSSASSGASAPPTDPSSASSLQNQFLTLLVAQLNNQDPLNPMDNSEMTSQLAQISTVQGITNLSSVVQSIGGQIDVSQSMDAVSMIGKQVLIPGDAVKLDIDASGAPVVTPIGVDLQADAQDVTVTINDSTGKAIRTIDMGPQSTGILAPVWDGKDDSGNVMPASDKYTIKVVASDTNGNAVTADALTFGQVQSISFATTGVQLDLGTAGEVSMLDIRKVLGT